MESGAVHALPVGRHFAIDERGVGLRLTWHLEHGFVNLSLWRHDRCVETFHLDPGAAANLIAFLVRGLADASSVAALAPVRILPTVEASTSRARRARDAVMGSWTRLRQRAADVLAR